MTDIIHKHTRSTITEGKKNLVAVVLTLLFFWVVGSFLFPEIALSDGWLVIFAISMIFLAAAVVVVISIFNIRSLSEFSCELDEHELRCHAPLKGVGESFQVAIQDIDRIEKSSESGGPHWTIWDKHGNKYELTRNYGNPAAKFVKLMLTMNENIEEIST